MLIGLALVGGWLLAAHVSPASLAYALVGFRIEALHVLSASSSPLHVRVHSLLGPGARSGLFVMLALGLRGLWTLRGDRVLAATLGAWLVAGTVGVLGGGSYWPHYLIQLIAPASLLAGAALTGVHPRVRAAAALALVAVAAIGTVAAAPSAQASRGRDVLHVARYVRTHARPGDTQYVITPRPTPATPPGSRAPTRTPGACSCVRIPARSRACRSSCGRRGARPGSSDGSARATGGSTRTTRSGTRSAPTTASSRASRATRSTTASRFQGVSHEQRLGRPADLQRT